MPKGTNQKKPGGDTKTAKATKPQKANGNGANLGFEAQLFLASDKLRKNLEPSDYKHVAGAGPIFLKYISMPSRRSERRWLRTPPRPKTRTSIWPKTCFGCRRKHAGRTCKTTPSSRPSGS